MLAHVTCLLVTGLLSALTLAPASAIRVDWNTNQGSIVPPTPRTTVRPQPPFRATAPVWEDFSEDIPDPNPFIYVLPPPSRPRPATNNYLTAERRPAISDYKSAFKYGKVVSPSELNAYLQNSGSHVVAALASQYVPNVGIKYAAVVAGGGPTPHWEAGGDKVQGKYNAKTKKYKAYEKAKYAPLNYYPLFDLAQSTEQTHLPEFDRAQLVREQQLPLTFAAASFAPASPAAVQASVLPAGSVAAAQPQPAQTHPYRQAQPQPQPQSQSTQVQPVSSTVTPSAKDKGLKYSGDNKTSKKQQQLKQLSKYTALNAIADTDAKRS